ncbi:GxxExxY protein [Flavobacteriaceae bacterium F08102]|nr:GxxExxY protein [Flavobacteriaceae bacterium F08102]
MKIKKESYQLIGLCIDIYNSLGKGFSEYVYSDALEQEMLLRNINFKREVSFEIEYNGTILRHKYIADFVINDKIILEIKATEAIHSAHIKQTLNYLAVAKLRLGLLVNFGEDSLRYKRVVL